MEMQHAQCNLVDHLHVRVMTYAEVMDATLNIVDLIVVEIVTLIEI